MLRLYDGGTPGLLFYRGAGRGSFIDTITAEDVKERSIQWPRHGYSPEKENYTTVFMASGKGIREKAVIPAMHLVDEGPTFASLLGLDLAETDGRMIEEILLT